MQVPRGVGNRTCKMRKTPDKMKNKTLAKIGLICLILLTSAGCVNYEQETYLNQDLSGRIELHFFFNPQPVITKIIKKVDTSDNLSTALEDAASKATYNIKINIDEKNFLEGFNQEAIKNKSFRKEKKDGMDHFYFTVEFDDIRKLFEGKKIVNVVEDKNGFVTYTEYFGSSKDKEKEAGSTEEDTEMMKGFNFKYTLHLPADIVSANTGTINKNTAVWEYPLEEVAKDKNFKVTATFKGENRFKRWLKLRKNK